MRRRLRPLDPADEPPARLRAFDPADWMPLVDVSEYDPDDYRNRTNYEPVGPVRFPLENWCLQRAWTLFSRGRMDWHREHGWPGGLDYVELFQETVQMRRKSHGVIDRFRLDHG